MAFREERDRQEEPSVEGSRECFEKFSAGGLKVTKGPVTGDGG